RAHLLEHRLIVHVDARHRVVRFGTLRLFLDADDAMVADFSHAEALRVVDLLEQNARASLLLDELLSRAANAAFNDVVAENDAEFLAVGEVLRQAERLRNAALTFLVSVIEVGQPKLFSVCQQSKKI